MKNPTRPGVRRDALGRDALVVVLEELMTGLIWSSNAIATLEARFRLLAQDPPRGLRGSDITRIAKPLLTVFREAIGKPRLVRQQEISQ